MTTVGVVGTGRMGSAIARAIRAAGHELVVWNRTRGPCDALATELGCRSAMTAADVAANSDVTISMLAD
ncbi:MAG TPA: NAD(P)-binding domain-containing protein, partial [Candidatus Limnocylindrales bacterium]|nr:NAD(P)-binding domain-containing protein [Candidatus Limnocylindrales bacterium]